MEKRRTLSVRRSANLVSCPAAWRSRRSSPRPACRAGSRFSFDWGEMNPRQSRLASGKNACTRHVARPRAAGRRTLQAAWSAGHSVSGAQVICGLPSCDLFGEVPPPANRAGSPIFIRLGRNESAPNPGFASAKRLYAMRRAPPRRAQENAGGMGSAGHSVSGAQHLICGFTCGWQRALRRSSPASSR